MITPSLTAIEEAIRAPLDSCWNRIGVRGDGTCPELKQYIHCRNCPVHGEAAARFFDRPLLPGHLDAWTPLVARREETMEQRTLAVFLFRIGAEWLALPPSVFQEAAALRPIHPLPHRRGGAVLGLVNIRGELLPCVSLGRILGIEPQPATEHRQATGRLLVAASEGSRTVFPVDEIHGIERFRPEELGESPATVARSSTPLARGVLPWRAGSAGLLDAERLHDAFNRSLA